MGTRGGDTRKIRVESIGQYAEGKRGSQGQGGVVTVNVGEQELIRLHGISCHEEMACGDPVETLGAFEGGGTGEAAFGAAVAYDEAGDAAFYEVLIEIGEQLPQALVCPAAGVGEQVDEGIEDDQMSFDPVDSFEEARKILWESEGAIPRWVRGVVGVMDVREDLDVGKICSPSREELELGCDRVPMRGNDDNSALKRRRVIRQGSTRRDVSGELQGEKGFLATVITVEERDTREGQTALPEPADGLGRGLGKVEWREGGRVGEEVG
jgi:hypothetical protein